MSVSTHPAPAAVPPVTGPQVRAAAGVAGWGSALPTGVVTNADLERRLDTDDEWITTRTGIRERRIATDGETTGPLAVAAARAALRSAGVEAADIDLIVVATCTAEVPMPSTAALVASELGTSAGGFDLDAACAGFGYALATTASLLSSGLAQRALLIGADTMSRVVDPDDRSTAVLFGDGAAALVLTDPSVVSLVPSEVQAATTAPRPLPGLVSADLVVDGAGVDLLRIPAGGSRMPATAATVAAGGQFIQMEGRELFRRAVREVVNSVQRTLDRAGVTAADVAWFVPHQANARIVDAVVARAGIAADRTLGNGDRYGNTSAASIPLVLAEAADEGRLHEGDLVLVSGFGAGLSVATVLWRWGRP